MWRSIRAASANDDRSTHTVPANPTSVSCGLTAWMNRALFR